MDTKEFIKGNVANINMDLEKQYAHYHGILKNAVEGQVVTRFPPEPSGYLHIGHVKAALLNFHYAKMYKGNMILRFDDTNPSKEKQEFVDAIIEDLHTLGVTFYRLTHTSDYFAQIHKYARKLITEGNAYVDSTPVEVMRKERLEQVESKFRNWTVEQNLQVFEQMVAGKADDYCLRAKIDMKSKNGCMRDPVLARTYKIPHQRTGKKFTLYPTYDFACPIVDSIEGVTHVLRTNEYADRIPQYQWVLQAVGFPKLQIFEYSRLNLQYTCLSKRKLQWFVDTGRVEGWDDPRFPTVRGVLRKGIKVETLIEFMLEQGPSIKANLMEWQKIWAINKGIIDADCIRYSAVSIEKASTLILSNGPKVPEAETIPKNKLNLPLGDRPVWKSSEILIEFDDAKDLFEVGKKITLMNWGNMMINTKELQEDGSYLMTGEYLPDDKDFKTTKKVTWLAKDSNLLIADLVEYDHLIKTEKVDEDANFEDIVNVNSRFPSACYVDSGLRTMNVGEYLQFQRRGYYKIDKIHKGDKDSKYELILTPDGKKRGIASIAKQTEKKGDVKQKDLAEKIDEKKQKTQPKKEKKKNDQPKEENADKKEEQKPEVVAENTEVDSK